LGGHMCGTVMPLFTLPDVTWKAFPVARLEGQYIIKNVVLVAGAFVVASAHLGRITDWLPRPVLRLLRFVPEAKSRPRTEPLRRPLPTGLEPVRVSVSRRQRPR